MIRFSLMSMFSVAVFTLASSAQANEPATSAVYQGDAAKGQPLASAVCGACHGPDGNSAAAANPKLAGQHAAYLFKQMRNFKGGPEGKPERTNAIMNGMIAPYTEEQMKDFAAYFAAQKQVGSEMKSRDTLELGKKLYRGGDASKGLPACAGCHGPAGAGLPAQFPRIGGQFPEYIEAQLKAFRVSERANDPNKMMQMIAIKMTDAEIRAVADYISGLH
jgi:cytochrome c553